jgi:diacylglycerol kinase
MRLLWSFRYAFRGLWQVLGRERNARIHVVAAAVALVAAGLAHLDRAEVALVVLAIALVLCAEIFNSVVEQVLDLLHPEHSQRVRVIKDASAAAVLVAALGAAALAGVLFGPRLVGRP